MTKRKVLLETVRKTARGLREAGLMDTKTMREFDALCLPPVKEYTAAQIKRIRESNKASQAVFAAYLNTSVSTVQKWERGEKKPNGPSLKLLSLVDAKGLQALAA
jgi:putative transcriptional regulator